MQVSSIRHGSSARIDKQTLSSHVNDEIYSSVVTSGRVSLDVRHLKLLLAVCEEGSLARAAGRLNLTPSALSHQLRRAERALGRPLFLREGRRMRATSAGARLRQSAELVLEELERAERELREAERQPEGTVRVSTECNTCYHWLPAALDAFQQRYPAVNVDVVIEATREPIRALLDGRIDVGIVSDPVKSSRIAVEPLFEDELVAVLPADHRLRKAPYMRAEDFASENLITYAAPKEELTVFTDVLQPAGVKPRRWMPMQLTEAMVEMVRAGQGIGVMARWAAEPHVRNGHLLVKRLTRKGLPRQWSAAWIKRRRPPAYLADFVRILARTSSPAVTALSRSGTNG
jgi:LysR family transcriptional regulator, regulator for metE and metH